MNLLLLLSALLSALTGVGGSARGVETQQVVSQRIAVAATALAPVRADVLHPRQPLATLVQVATDIAPAAAPAALSPLYASRRRE